MHRLILVAFLTATIVRADTRADLDATLAAFTGRDPIRVLIDFELSNVTGDPKKPELETSATSARVLDTPDGLQISWDRQQIEAVAGEKEGGGKGVSSRRAMDALSVTQLSLYLNAAPSLIEALKDASLTSERNMEWQGQPARELVFRLEPKLSEKDRKYIKEIEATAHLWLTADGKLLAADRKLRVKGRAMLVITFESTESEHYAFACVGDRLVVTEHVKEGRGSGAGESNERKTTARLTIAPPIT